jgi:putative tryptophan/tyrosine transport system substrate-binding protein
MSYAPAFRPTLEDETDDNLGGGLHGASIGGGMTGYFLYRRREFITLIGGAATWPLVSRAQQADSIPRVGVVSTGADPNNPVIYVPFFEQMRQLGYIDGQNIVFERRFAAGAEQLIGYFVADLVRRPVDVIVVTGQREGLAAKQATSSIPIVMVVNPDPIGMGLAASLARPGGNVTGLTTMDFAIYGKRVEILKEAVPGLKKIALLVSPSNLTYKRGTQWARDIEVAAGGVGIELAIIEAAPADIDATIADVAARGAGGLVVAFDGVYVARRVEIAHSTIKHEVPAIFGFREHAEVGGLLVYAARISDLSRRAAFFVDRILKGTKAADLPIEQPTKFDLIVNLKTAKALGLEIPPTLLARADEVIE